MYSILDIVTSLTLRGAIVLAVLNMTIALQGKLSEKTAQANMFSLTTTVARIMSDDNNMVGFGVGGTSFTTAKSDTIGFTFLDPTNGYTQTWIKYFMGDSLELYPTTPNPSDRILYRSIATGSGSPGAYTRKALANGAVKLVFSYYDASGTTTSTLSSIKSFKVYLIMATGDKVNNLYPTAEWTYRFFPPNIN